MLYYGFETVWGWISRKTIRSWEVIQDPEPTVQQREQLDSRLCLPFKILSKNVKKMADWKFSHRRE